MERTKERAKRNSGSGSGSKKAYTSPAVQITRVALEGSIADTVASPVKSYDVDDWIDGGGKGGNDTGDIMLSL